MKYRVERKGVQHEVDVELTSAGYVVRGADGEAQLIRFEQRSDRHRRTVAAGSPGLGRGAGADARRRHRACLPWRWHAGTLL
jgi:hypothetical protein